MISMKHIALFIICTGVIALVLLAGSLSNLKLQAGAPFPGSSTSGSTVTSSALQGAQNYGFPILRGIFALLFLGLILSVPIRMIAFLRLKRLLQLVIAAVILFVLIMVLPPTLPGQPSLSPSDSSAAAIRPAAEYLTSPLGRPPEGLVWSVLAVVVMGILGLIIWTLIQPAVPGDDSDRLQQEAENSLSELMQGRGDFKNVILRCYSQMTEVLRQDKAIERDGYMTAREFEQWLESKGIPPEPAQNLTDLFERVRYGQSPISDEEEQLGRQSLKEIIHYCRQGKGPRS